MSEEKYSRSVVEHARSQQRRRDYWTAQEQLREAIEKCAKALERGEPKHYHYVAAQLHQTILPGLLDGDTPRAYDSAVMHRSEWDYGALSAFYEAPEVYMSAASRPDPSVSDARTVIGDVAGPQQARRTIARAYRSAVCIAEEEGVVAEELLTRVDAIGFTAKLGEHLQDAEMDIGAPVRVVSERSGALKTLHCGGTGQGKSAGLEREAEDYYLLDSRRGRGMKIIDLVGMRDGENWFYDIPQRDEHLQGVREDMGLPPSVADADREIADLEIRVPLTPGLAERELPYDTEDEAFTIKPFTVPASEIRKPLLVSMLVTQLTPQQEGIVRDAYDEVNNSTDDWSLRDIAEEVRHRDELGPDKKKPVIRTLRQLQNKAFIRTQEHDRTIDWRETFQDTETVTVFSQALIGGHDGEKADEIAKYITFGYLVDRIVRNRERMYDIPQVCLLMRELWKVAPHQLRQSFDARAAALQEAIGHMLAEMFRENRHSGIHLLADTQQLSDLLKPVREMFNRYVVYNTSKDLVKNIFEYTANDSWRSFYDSLTPKPGHASVVGMVEPAVDERGIEYVGPIQYAPPGHHHRIAPGNDTGGQQPDLNGWRARERYLDREDLRAPAAMGLEWDDTLPTRLEITAHSDGEDASGPDVHTEPVAAFRQECLVVSQGSAVKKADVRTAFSAYLHDHDRDGFELDTASGAARFGRRLSKTIDAELGETSRDGKQAYNGLALTNRGQQYLQAAMDGLEDASESIRGD